jgi:hypothetical protein
MNNYEKEMKKLSEMPQEDLESQQHKIFKPATFSKKEKILNLEKIDLQVEIGPKKKRKESKDSKPKKKKKLNSNSLVSYSGSDSD